MPGRHIRWIGIAADIVAVPVAVFLAYLFRYGHRVGTGLLQPTRWGPLIVALTALVAWLSLYEPLSLDCLREGWCLRTALSRIIFAAAIQMGVVLALAYMIQLYYSRLVLMYFAAIFCTLILLIRLVAYEALLRRHRAGRARRVVIIGEGRIADELTHRIELHPEFLYEVVGFLNPSLQPGNGREVESKDPFTQLGAFDVIEMLEKKSVTELLVCLDHSPVELQSFLAYCRERRFRVNLVPQPYELFGSRVKLLNIGGIPLISLEGLPDLRAVATFKRAADLILALPLGLLSLPVVFVSALVLKFQGCRLLRRELRCGQFGDQFWMYRLDVDRWASNKTAFQGFLCRSSISELPQLWNVLTGQMSLVGPRPESLERASAYSDWQKQRLMVKPGMTGLAQVNGLREQHSSDEKARYDLHYIVRWTPAVDLLLLLETIWVLVARSWTKSGTQAEPSDKSSILSTPATRT